MLPDLEPDPVQFANREVVEVDVPEKIIHGDPMCNEYSNQHCIIEQGMRKLLRVRSGIINSGTGPLEIPAPIEGGPLYVKPMCYVDNVAVLARFRIFNRTTGALIDEWDRYSRCVSDDKQIDPTSPTTPFYTTCDQRADYWGIQAGWEDLEQGEGDCTYIDVTHIPRGTYDLKVEVNPYDTLRELRKDNNTLTATIAIP